MLQCKECGRIITATLTLSTKEAFVAHKKREHGKYVCIKCGQEFWTPGEEGNHYLLRHTTNKTRSHSLRY